MRMCSTPITVYSSYDTASLVSTENSIFEVQRTDCIPILYFSVTSGKQPTYETLRHLVSHCTGMCFNKVLLNVIFKNNYKHTEI
jgi:hypothetical protein